MRIGSAAASWASLLIAIACGSSPGTSGPAIATDSSIARYGALTSDVQGAALSYGGTMAGPGMTLAGCAAAHDAYDAQVRARVTEMVRMSASMDAFMDAHGGSAYADMACVAQAMLDELDAHALVACTFPTLSGDEIEAARHVAVMTSYTGHLDERCGQMAGGSYMWAPAAPVCSGGSTGAASDPLALGERIFDTGVGADGTPLARTGSAGMMMSSGCASCHGYDGLGRTTMMFTAPDITYANLTDPAGMLEPDGSRGPTYTDDQIRRAVTQGIDAGGATLSTVMPRWQLGDTDWADLLLFLESLSPPAATSGGGTPPAGSGTVTGSAFMGAVRAGTVTAYGVSGGMLATPLGTAAVDASGTFSVAIGAYAGTVVLKMTGGTFADEATGATMTMQASDAQTSGIPSVAAGATTTGIQITPLTTMAEARAQAMAGGLTAANVTAANSAVGRYFAVGDILSTVPMDPSVAGSGAGAATSAENSGMAIAAMSQYAQTVGMTSSSSGMFTAFALDASDGVMNGLMGSTPIPMGGMGGMGGMTGGSTMPAPAGTTGLGAAMAAFVGSPRNASGVPLAEMQPLVDKLDASDGTLR